MSRLVPVRALYYLLTEFGFDPQRLARAVSGLPVYTKNFVALRQQRQAGDGFAFGRPFPCLNDRSAESGTARGHYFHQDLLAASRIFRANPEKHVDVGSRVDGFVAHVASFRPIVVVDVRENPEAVRNISFVRADMMAELPPELVGACDSLSCLHALEHFGLGRYGEPIRWDGHLIGLRNLGRMLQPRGTLYFSTPIGPQRIEYNAHRVFSLSYLLAQFAGAYEITDFSYVDDAGRLHESVALSPDAVADNFGCTYGCGIFELTKC